MQHTVKKKSLLLFLSIFMFLTGCQFTPSAFAKTAGDTGSALAAAMTTLQYFHEGKLFRSYAQASFEAYQNELDSLDQQLVTQAGAPVNTTVKQLTGTYKLAIQVIDHPCLEADCNWQKQVKQLDVASKAFLKAANG